ncbi:MAG: SAM-dependent methyltransferase [Candidatus Magnetominusculus sp. LBB02]|nr:SAM-dependent methyltransferase [Candidatus Magnetominusculus sp. LBB02]
MIRHQCLPAGWSEREALRDKGQFWTPGWIAEAMVAYVAKDTDLIFDPAAGRGAFLEALLKIGRQDVLYFGTDTDKDLLTDKIYNNKCCLVEERDFIKHPPLNKFRAIVANPPYIRHHRIDNDTKLLLKRLSVRIIGHSIDGRAGYHIFFLIQALNLLEKNGRLAFIMPADTCEGTFAGKLWKWISEKFCIEAVITFESMATPFPSVDTNAIIFMIKNSRPVENILWVKSNEAHSTDLLKFVSSDFKTHMFDSLEIVSRNLGVAIATGLTRPQQAQSGFTFRLNAFATVMRGIATGSNEFFFLTARQVKELAIPAEFIKRAIGRTRDVTGDILTVADVNNLEDKDRPTYLFSINGHSELPDSVSRYLEIGQLMGLSDRPLIKQRSPWYKMETREVPPLLFAYLGRRNTRFILNEAGVVPLTGFLCVYPLCKDKAYTIKLWEALNHPDTLSNLPLVGKSYGSGAIKVEPGNLSVLPIPQHIVKQYELKRPAAGGQLSLFPD